MERIVCLIFKVLSLLSSNFKTLWTKVSCVQKATRRVYYIGSYKHLIGSYGQIKTRYVYNTARYAYIGQKGSCDVQFMSRYVQQFHAVLNRSQGVIPILQFVIKSVFYSYKHIFSV